MLIYIKLYNNINEHILFKKYKKTKCRFLFPTLKKISNILQIN